MAEERNSEATFTKVMGVVALTIAGLAGAVEALSEAGLAEHWEGFAVLVSVFAVIGKLVDSYIKSRPDKHLAMKAQPSVKPGNG